MAYYFDSKEKAEELIRKLGSHPLFYAEIELNNNLHKWMVDEEDRVYGKNIRVIEDLTDHIDEIRCPKKPKVIPDIKHEIKPVFKTVAISKQKYKTIVLGDQEWLAENLRVTHYRNGDSIPNVINDKDWNELYTGARCAYENAESYADTYGYLYNWYAVYDSRNIAPAGWHVPTDKEWQTLVDYLGGNEIAGGILKEPGTAHWKSPNTEAMNKSGFTALPAGWRLEVSHFDSLGEWALFWSSSEDRNDLPWYRGQFYLSPSVARGRREKQMGLSVRLLRD